MARRIPAYEGIALPCLADTPDDLALQVAQCAVDAHRRSLIAAGDELAAMHSPAVQAERLGAASALVAAT